MKNLIFDSGALISLAEVGLVKYLEKFKERNPFVKIYITDAVYDETIAIKNKVSKFSWTAVQYESLIKKGVIEIIPINKNLVNNLEIKSNKIFYTVHGNIEILQAGELESVISAKEKQAILVIDEITTRWLIEHPNKLHNMIEKRYKEKVMVNKEMLNLVHSHINSIPVIRSVDLVSFMIKNNYFEDLKNVNFKKPLLYAIKNAGCATTYEEIDNYLR